MSKEKILEEFIQLRIKIPYQNFNLSPSDFYKLENGFIVLQDFFLKAIDQTREETIRKVEELLPEETFDDTYNYALKEVRDILNKLKKNHKGNMLEESLENN